MKSIILSILLLLSYSCSDSTSGSSNNSCVTKSENLIGEWTGSTIFHQISFNYPNNYDTVDYDVELTLTVTKVVGLSGDGDEADLRNPTTKINAIMSGKINGSKKSSLNYEGYFFCNESEFRIFDVLSATVNSSFTQMEVKTETGFPYIEPKSNSSGNIFDITLIKK